MDDSVGDLIRQVTIAATSSNVAEEIREAVMGPVERAIVENTNPSTLLEVEAALGGIRDADPSHPSNTLPEMAQAVEDALRDAIDRGSREAR
jgi:hypothetical protein